MGAVWTTAIGNAAAGATILLGVAGLLALGLRHRSATLRHLAWSVGLAGTLLLPLLDLVVPAWPVPVPDGLSGRIDFMSPANRPARSLSRATRSDEIDGRTRERPPALSRRHAPRATGDASYEPPPTTTHGGPRTGATRVWPPEVWLFVWLLGVGVSGFRPLLSRWRVSRLARRADELAAPAWTALAREIATELGIRRRVRLLRSSTAAIPMTWGWWRPVVLLGPDADRWSAERRTLVLRHELVHVKRGDYLTHLLGQWSAVLYWFHPLVWLATRRLRVERERACDDAILNSGTRASTYASHLLAIAQSVHTTPTGAATGIAMARRSQLEGRLMAILDPHVRRVATRATAAVVVGLLLVVAFAVSVVTPDAQTAPTAGQSRPAVASEPVDEDLERVRQDLTRRSREVVRRVRDQTDLAALDLDLDVEAIAREARALAREVTENLEWVEVEQERAQDDPPLDPRLVEAFIRALGDPDAEVREEAARALARHRVPEAVTALVGALEDDNPEVREQAARALGRTRDPAAVDGLAGRLQDDVPDVAERAAQALGNIRDERAVSPLSAALSAESPDVRERAAWALGRIRSADAVPALSTALGDESADVREQAARALGRIRSVGSVDALVAALSDSEEDVQEAAARALGRIRDPGAIDGLVAALGVAQGDALHEVITAIGRLGGDRAIDALLELMDSTNEETRRAVISALSGGGNRGWVDPDPDPDPDPDLDPDPGPNPSVR